MPGVTYNKTAWHLPNTHSSAAPTPTLAKLRNQYYAYVITPWKYHGHGERGTTTISPDCSSTTPGALKCRSFFSFLFLPTGLRSSEALSGNGSAELTMQQPGKQKSYDEYPCGLHYEHFYTPIRSLPLEGDMFNSPIPCLSHYLYHSAFIAALLE